ncbi:MAG TPA: hypothetical protein DEA55_11955 [Rhodospirillaceae bacterium]|nr:hypothetical protein [Rhodospirillaceae bacterium]
MSNNTEKFFSYYGRGKSEDTYHTVGNGRITTYKKAGPLRHLWNRAMTNAGEPAPDRYQEQEDYFPIDETTVILNDHPNAFWNDPSSNKGFCKLESGPLTAEFRVENYRRFIALVKEEIKPQNKKDLHPEPDMS